MGSVKLEKKLFQCTVVETLSKYLSGCKTTASHPNRYVFKYLLRTHSPFVDKDCGGIVLHGRSEW
jgi:hypothetical protein